MTINYYSDTRKIATICVDEQTKTVSVENYTNDIIDRPFGRNENPSYSDFISFMERRCIPKSNDIMQQCIEAIGIDTYDPIAICRKTKGRMHEDAYWMEFVD